jgi:hypothetical protein
LVFPALMPGILDKAFSCRYGNRTGCRSDLSGHPAYREYEGAYGTGD